MKYFLYLISLIVVLVFNFGILEPIGLGLAVPSVLLLVIICIGTEYGSLDFFFFALLGGLWMDLYFALPIGSFSGAYVFCGLASYTMYQRLSSNQFSAKYYLIFIAGAQLFLLIWLWAYTNLVR